MAEDASHREGEGAFWRTSGKPLERLIRDADITARITPHVVSPFPSTATHLLKGGSNLPTLHDALDTRMYRRQKLIDTHFALTMLKKTLDVCKISG